MANVINGTEYSTLATYYGTMVNVLQSATIYLYNAVSTVASFTDVDPTVDLIVPFNNVYTNQTQVINSTSQFLDAVRALNQHVLTRAVQPSGAPYTDIAVWMADQTLDGYPVHFPQSWANLCAQTGITDVGAFVQ
jgi:hypothetical protein